jgi:hypothetical protein
MRIEFPLSARDDFRWTQSLLRVGSAPDNDLLIAAHQGASHHLRIQQDRRGWVLQVLPGCGRIYVNARPVRERALLRPGDILSMGDCRMLLCADENPTQRAPLAFAGQGRCTVALRAVAGPLSGRVWPLSERLELGPQGNPPLALPQGEAATFSLGWRDGELQLEAAAASTRYPLRVNGTTVERVALQPGDQLGIAMHRFVVDAPGLVPVPVISSPQPAQTPLPEETAGPRGEVWWLIVTAAVLALGMALMLLIRF